MKSFFTIAFFLFAGFLNTAFAYDLVVSKDGTGNYTTVQAAINAVPTGLSAAYTIYIRNGRYKEKINIPSSKPFIQLIGESVANTILTYDDYASKMTSCAGTVGTQNSASVTVNATDFTAINITFENNYGDGSQAVAIVVNADRAVFSNCRFLGNQDTVYLKGGTPPRAYFTHCYIDGNVDFIFGNSVALFDSCVVYAKSRTSTATSYITAPNTPTGQAYGFVFSNCKLPNNTGTTSYYMSRPWPSPSEALTAQKAVYLNCLLSSHINPAGWTVWNASTITANLYYGEYNSRYFNGVPVDVSSRVPWSYQLSVSDAATYTFANMFGTWDPCSVAAGICTPAPSPIAVSNFRVVKNAGNSQFYWNISWPMTGIDYTLYRSSDNIVFAPVYTTSSTNDTAVNFQYTDASVPASGSNYYYYLAASKSGLATHNTDTITIWAKQLLVVNASASLSFCGLSQSIGTPSAAQQYTITGSNLTNDVTITPPLNFEVSIDNVNWYTNSSPLTITPVAGTLATTTVYIRLNAASTGNFSGNILNASTGASSVNVPVSGVTYPVSTSDLLQEWALTLNTNDSVPLRSPGVTASTSSLYNLFATDGTLPAPAGTVPAYSTTLGQVLGANAAGNNWQNVGGTLKRNYYEQFTVTATTGYTVRLDSITFQSDFYGTSSGTKMACAYSKNGFSAPADSAEFNDGVNAVGTSLVLTASGTFAKSFPVAQNNAGPVDYFALSLNGINGVTLLPGQTLTIRLYWACSSTGTPRFSMLKNVKIMGVASLAPVPLKLLSFNAQQFGKRVKLIWQTQNELNSKNFDVERSLDGRNFYRIGIVPAKNSGPQNDYYLFDPTLPEGLVYYRLKITDNDGTYRYSDIISVNVDRSNGIKVISNPVNDQIVLQHPVAQKGACIELYSADGRLAARCQTRLNATVSSISTVNLPAGTYQIMFSSGKEKQWIRVVKL